MANPARRETDSLLEELEKRIAEEYGKAANEMQEKAEKYFASFETRDAEKKALVKSGDLSRADYRRWRAGAIMHGERYTELIDHLSGVAVNTDKAAMGIIADAMPNVFMLNANYGTFEVERLTGVDTSFVLYNENSVAYLLKDNPDLLPSPKPDSPTARKLAENKDLIWNKQHLNSAVLQGILQGDSMKGISKRLLSVTDMDKTAAIRNARTMTTGAENAGKKHAYERASQLGLHVRNMWMATHDGRTRESHRLLDGEIRELDEKFSNGLEYPGDPNGEPEEVYNCRCSLVAFTQYSAESPEAFRTRTGMQEDPDKAWTEWKESRKAGGKEKQAEFNWLAKTGEGYTPEQRQQLEELLKNAPQDVQDFYKKYIDGANPIVQNTKNGYYQPRDNTVHFTTSRAAAGDTLNTPYQLHFHEYGHNLDYLANNSHVKALSEKYRDPSGKSFEQVITAEWDKIVSQKTMEFSFNQKVSFYDSEVDFVSAYIELYKADHGSGKGLKIYNAMLSEFNSVKGTPEGVFEFYTKHYTELEGKLTLAAKKTGAQELIAEVKRNYGLKERGDLSDMFERYSCKVGAGAYPFGAGHGKTYAMRDGALGKEAFAEMFAAEVSNKGSLEVIKEYLPESYGTFHDILKEAVNP